MLLASETRFLKIHNPVLLKTFLRKGFGKGPILQGKLCLKGAHYISICLIYSILLPKNRTYK
jgi:hypothetical protein